MKLIATTLTALAFALALACGEPACMTCRNDTQCGVGEICLTVGPNAGTCARECSLTVWHVGDDWDAPCPAGVGTCPETCTDQDGVFGHCSAHAGLPDDVGVCLAPTGELVCP